MIEPNLARRIMTASRKGREWVVRRDALIREAVDAGATQIEVAKFAGLSQAAVSGIVNREIKQ